MNSKQLAYAKALRAERPNPNEARELLMARYNNLLDTDNYENANWLGEIDSAVFVVVVADVSHVQLVEWDEEAFAEGEDQ